MTEPSEMTKADRVATQLTKQLAEFLQTLPDDRADVIAARRALVRLTNLKNERHRRATYVAVLAPNSVPESLEMRKVLANVGLNFAHPGQTDDGAPVYLLQAEEALLKVFYPTISFPRFPALVRVVEGDMEEIVTGLPNVLRYLLEEGAAAVPEELCRPNHRSGPYQREKLRRSSTACALRTITDVTYRRVCCGGKVKETRASVCPYHTLLNVRQCLKCEYRLVPGAEVEEDLLGLIEMRKAELAAKIEEEIAAGRALP